MTLCSHRPEGFGPHSNIHTSLPTTCFVDVIVVPLATWIFLVFLPIPILIYIRSRRSDEKPDEQSRKSLLARILAGIYYVLIVAMLAMQSLEIARLVVAELGIGLLPFTYAGVLIAALLHYFTSSVASRAVSVLFWLMLAATMAIQMAALIKEEGKYNRRGVTDNYPLGDQVTDVATMVGVEIVLAVLEFLAR